MIARTLLCVLLLAGCDATLPPADMQSEDPLGRARGVIAAADANDQAAVPILVDRLEDWDPVVRMFAIRALAKLTGRTMRYRYYDPEPARARAVTRWRAWLNSNPHPHADPNQATRGKQR